jgi:acyl-CoA reductase-like NAD-dependent aldehyde dehydrogenase
VIPAIITIIGSTRTGREVVRNSATSVKHLSLELGGNAPVLVYPDADLDNAVARVTGLKYENCGQICVSPNRVFVHEDVYDAFVAKAVEAARAVKLGWGREPGVQMGPMMTARDRDRFLAWTRQAVEEGAALLTGGGVPKGKRFEKGYWVEPTVS